jgi:hypothetical protein
MTPTEIQALLSDAIPELVWSIVGASVSAAGVPISAYHGEAPTAAMWPTARMLRFVRATDAALATLHPDDLLPGRIAAAVNNLLTAADIRTCPGARRLDAARRVYSARDRVAATSAQWLACNADQQAAITALDNAKRRLITTTRAAKTAEDAFKGARRDLAAAEERAAKVGA